MDAPPDTRVYQQSLPIVCRNPLWLQSTVTQPLPKPLAPVGVDNNVGGAVLQYGDTTAHQRPHAREQTPQLRVVSNPLARRSRGAKRRRHQPGANTHVATCPTEQGR